MIIFLLTLNRSNYFELSSELASRYKIWASSFVSKFNLAKTYGFSLSPKFSYIVMPSFDNLSKKVGITEIKGTRKLAKLQIAVTRTPITEARLE